jgi:hypothetical protein
VTTGRQDEAKLTSLLSPIPPPSDGGEGETTLLRIPFRTSPCRAGGRRSAAEYIIAFVILLATCTAHARINVVTLPARDSVQLTIYNSVDLTLVKETRVLTFRQGINKLEFSWANTLIDPTSVEFKALTHADAVDVLDVSFPPRVSNTLEWRIQSAFAGEVTVEIRYFTSGINGLPITSPKPPVTRRP